MANFQTLLDNRICAIEKHKKAISCLSRLNCCIAERKCEKRICEHIKVGGREILTSALENIPFAALN